MTAASSAALYANYKKFIRSRAAFWKPKIQADLKRMISHGLGESSIELAIKNLEFNMLKPSGLAITLQKIYVDAARVWGGKIFQGVKKQAAEIQRRAALAAKANAPLQPIGYNEELIAEVISYMRLHNLQMVTEITDTMKDFILRQLVEAQRTGASIGEVANIVAAGSFPANRAIVISRTETIKAANFGAVQAAKKSGFKLEKEWISAKDIRTRRIPRDEFSHVEMNGKTAQIDEPFHVPNRHNSFDLLQQPGDPSGNPADVIQCRCTIGFNVIRGANGLPLRANGHGLLTIPAATIPATIKPPAFVPPAPEPAKPEPKVFKPAKTIKEAEAYAIKEIGVKYVNFKGLHIDIVNDINKSVFNMKQVMPDIRTNGIGNAQEANKAMKAKIVAAYKDTDWFKQTLVPRFGQETADKAAVRFANSKVEKVSSGTLAWSTNRATVSIPSGGTLDVSEFVGVFVNEKEAKSKITLDELIRKNRHSHWYANSANDFGYIMHHELGHEIDKTIGFRGLASFKEIFKREHSQGVESLKARLSGYGATAGGRKNALEAEMIAEAWAEFMTSAAPRPLSKEIGELVLKTYYDKNRQTIDADFTTWSNTLFKLIRDANN